MRLISFGCSYTYGHGLPDCLEKDNITQGPQPSQQSFSAILSKKLNCENINLGKSGNSNKEIWNDVLNFNFQKDDIAVITWTYFSRFCIIKSSGIRRINPWNDEEKLYYMNYSSRHDMVLDFYCRMNHASYFLTTNNILNFSFVIEYPDMMPEWSQNNILGKFEMLDKADDNCHPGLISHKTYSENIYKIILPHINSKNNL